MQGFMKIPFRRRQTVLLHAAGGYTARMVSLDKIKGCFMLGACGDALGAPIEGVKDLSEILKLHGAAGLRDIIPFTNAYGSGKNFPAGRITDDTTMEMASVSALLLNGRVEGMTDGLRSTLWQAWLNWAQHQDDGAALAPKIDKAIQWPEGSEDFWFYCGAGRGTLAALMQDAPGSLARPMDYDCIVRGRPTKGPNEGCGGMMRVAPFALLDLDAAKTFVLGCESAAITHGHPDAYVATGAVALLVHFAGQDMEMKQAVAETIATLEKFRADPVFAKGVESCVRALKLAQLRASEAGGDFAAMDGLPKLLGYDNAFLAVPVLAHTAFALLSHPAASETKQALIVAANHSGDSDSVAAIVGNVLGARHGLAAVPAEYGDALLQKKELLAMAEKFHAGMSPPSQAPKPPRHTL